MPARFRLIVFFERQGLVLLQADIQVKLKLQSEYVIAALA